jgi:hypothetical protein
MNKNPQDDELLLPFEKNVMSGGYGDYYQTKRNNFFASVQSYGGLWKFHLLLDEIWLRGINDLHMENDPARSIPMFFFIAAHAKTRISVELAFSGCIQEAHSIMRDAVESTAFGHYMFRKPEMQEVWLRKDEPEGKKLFSQSFEKDKKLNLFAGLDELHRRYAELSEMGSHPTLQSLSSRIKITESADATSFDVVYTGMHDDEKTRVTTLFVLLMTCFTIENTFFPDYKDRLQLDDKLVEMRTSFDSYKESLRRDIIERFNITDQRSQ